MSTIYRPDEFDVLSNHSERIRNLESGCPPFIEPLVFLGGWTNAGLPYEPWGYRVCDGQLEFKGHLTPGSSGVPCYNLPADYRILNGVPTWLTDIVSGGGFSIARVFVDVTTGDITITFPAS